MFENHYSFFHYCLLSCCNVMLQKAFGMNRNGDAIAVVRGGRRPWPLRSDGTLGPTVATALATSTKNDTPVANFVNSR